jgi:hypothetical protein
MCWLLLVYVCCCRNLSGSSCKLLMTMSLCETTEYPRIIPDVNMNLSRGYLFAMRRSSATYYTSHYTMNKQMSYLGYFRIDTIYYNFQECSFSNREQSYCTVVCIILYRESGKESCRRGRRARLPLYRRYSIANRSIPIPSQQFSSTTLNFDPVSGGGP